MSLLEKKCAKCHEVKSVDQFYKNACRKDGLTCQCKSCIAAYSKEYAKTHKNEVLKRNRLWRKNNIEYARERDKKYRAKNQEKIQATQRKYRETHKENLYEKGVRYRETNRDYFREKANERKKLIRDTSDGSITKESKESLLAHQQIRCAYCGADLGKTRKHLDHIIPLSRGGKNVIDNVHFVCSKCDSSKGSRLESEWLTFLANINDQSEWAVNVMNMLRSNSL